MVKILVTYSSKYGSTAEIAAAIGNTLSEKGLDVRVISADSVNDVTPYDAFIVGSAVYAGQWMSGARDFLEQHADMLSRKPLWIFSSGPTGKGDASELLHGWELPEALRALADQLQPRAIMLFHGKIDPQRLNLGERLLVRAVGGATGDFRDWDMIQAWAEEVAGALVTA